MDTVVLRNWVPKRSVVKKSRSHSRKWDGHLFRRLFLEALETRTAPATTGVIGTTLPTVVSTAGSALSFNGTSDYLITPNLASSFSTTSVTIELWFKANGPGVILDELGSTTLNTGWHDSQIEILSSGQVDAGVDGLNPVSLGTASFGGWNFVALRYNSSTSTLDGMLNGVASSTTVSGSRSAPFNDGFGLYYAFGSSDGTNLGSGAWLNGSIDDVSIWNVARSNSEIQADMAQPPSTPQTGLVADYQLDDGTGLTAVDKSSGNHTASLGGGAVANAPAWVTSNAPIDGIVSTGTANTQTAIDHFAVTFNQPLNATAAGTAANYSLTGSSGDPTYVLTPSYSAGSTTVNFTMAPEPLQPGTYSFNTLSGLTDSSGNAGDALLRCRFRSATRRMGRLR